MTEKSKKGSKKTLKEIGEFVQIFDRIWQTLGKYADGLVTFSREKAHKIKLRFHGKTIAVIGPVAAGKTTMLNILKEPSITIDPMIYEKTTDPISFADKIKVEWKLPLDGEKKAETVVMKVRKPKDVGGEIAIRDAKDGWIEVCTDADYLFYLFDAYNYSNDDKTKARLASDFEWLANHAQEFAGGFKIIAFANKMDKIIERYDFNNWVNQEIPQVEDILKEALGPYSNHLSLIAPCSLLSLKRRTAAISEVMKLIADPKY